MPKKKNFLGGMQNYNPNNGEYESALVGKNGEPVSSFKSFKKQDSEFDKANAKRMGKKLNKVEDWRISEALDDAKWSVTQNTSVGQYAKEIAEKLEIDAEDVLKVMSKEAGRELKEDENLAKILFPDEESEESEDEKDVGKIIKYQPMLNNNGNFDYGEDVRAKKLNNGLAMETKRYKYKGQFTKNEKGQYEDKYRYKMVDIDSGLSVGYADSYEEALKKSKDPEFVEKLERARANYWKAHPDRKREKPESKSDSAKKLSFKKEMDKARAKMEKYWSNTDLNRHMRGEMDYLLSNFEHDNGKQYAIDEAKRNIQKWQKFGWLDTNEMRDEKLVYFQKMIEYMENNK